MSSYVGGKGLPTKRKKEPDRRLLLTNQLVFKDGCPCLSAEDKKMFCSYCQEFLETNSSQDVVVTVKNFTLSLPLKYSGMMLKTQKTVSMGKTKG